METAVRSPKRQLLATAIAAHRSAVESGRGVEDAAAALDDAIRAIVIADPVVISIFREHRSLSRMVREASRVLHFFSQQQIVPEPSSDFDKGALDRAAQIDATIGTYMDALAALRVDPDAPLPGEGAG